MGCLVADCHGAPVLPEGDLGAGGRHESVEGQRVVVEVAQRQVRALRDPDAAVVHVEFGDLDAPMQEGDKNKDGRQEHNGDGREATRRPTQQVHHAVTFRHDAHHFPDN